MKRLKELYEKVLKEKAIKTMSGLTWDEDYFKSWHKLNIEDKYSDGSMGKLANNNLKTMIRTGKKEWVVNSKDMSISLFGDITDSISAYDKIQRKLKKPNDLLFEAKKIAAFYANYMSKLVNKSFLSDAKLIKVYHIDKLTGNNEDGMHSKETSINVEIIVKPNFKQKEYLQESKTKKLYEKVVLKEFDVGDRVKYKGKKGEIDHITMNHYRLKLDNGKEITISKWSDIEAESFDENIRVGDKVHSPSGYCKVIRVSGNKVIVRCNDPVGDFEYNLTQIHKESAEDPCWKGYTMLGLKDKDGKKVPNCVKEARRKIYKNSYIKK